MSASLPNIVAPETLVPTLLPLRWLEAVVRKLLLCNPPDLPLILFFEDVAPIFFFNHTNSRQYPGTLLFRLKQWYWALVLTLCLLNTFVLWWVGCGSKYMLKSR